MNTERQPAHPKFWSKVQKTDTCWLWVGCRSNRGGYGKLNINGKTVQAHRHSYEVHHGPIPDGWFVCHRCDNPPCVNPAHLYAGTRQMNEDDKVAKGRSTTGEKNAACKITEADVREIRAMIDPSVREISEKYKISVGHARKILNGTKWKHIL